MLDTLLEVLEINTKSDDKIIVYKYGIQIIYK